MQDNLLEQFQRTSHISGGNAAYVEDLFEQYLKDPNSVPESWREYFNQLPMGGNVVDVPHSAIRQQFEQLGKSRVQRVAIASSYDGKATEYERKQVSVIQMISAYRQRGHQQAQLDPLGLQKRAHVPDLDLSFHNLSEADYDTVFQASNFYIGKNEATLREIHTALQ